MKTKTILILILLAVLAAGRPACAQGTAFTYQGSLESNGSPANGVYDLQFTLFDAAQNGNRLGSPLTNSAVTVNNGLFTTTLDFGPGVFNGSSCWLGIGVRASGGGAFTALTPLQQLTPTPYAIFAETAGAAGSVGPGSVTAAQLNTAGAPASGQVLSFNGSSLVWTNPGGTSSGWGLTGNAGTTPGDFLGTTDNQPLELRVNSERALDLYQGADNGINLTVGPFAGAEIGGQGINVLAGGYPGAYNTVYPNFSTIAGGYNNTINTGGPESFIAGGQGNVISGGGGAIGGGSYNIVNGSVGTIPGGANNLVSGAYGFAAGNSAQAVNPGAFVWADNSGGAFASTANNQFSVRANGGVRFVTGGAGMTIDGQPVSTGGGGGGGGGAGWSLAGNIGTIPGVNFLGTLDNQPLELWVNDARAFRLEPNASGQPNVVGGSGTSVTPGAVGATIGGGAGNTISVNGNYAAVGGGYHNSANGPGAFVGGGGYDGTTFAGNAASYGASTVAGGLGNMASAYYTTIGGGYSNAASQTFASVGGGAYNSAGGFVSTVPGGLRNTASGDYSFAAGSQAVAAHTGAFVWADDETGPFSSTANNQFSVRASGGVRFVTGGAGMTLDGVPVVPGGGGGGGGGSSSNSWLLTGNAGANPASGYFLGTTDTNALELHVDGARGLRLDYAGRSVSQFSLDRYGSINVNNGYWGNTISNNVLGATIAGGGYEFGAILNRSEYPNIVTEDFGTIGGGYGNTAGNGATVPGGLGNTATGTGSFAAGQNANALDGGSFVWGDGTAYTASRGANTFTVLASGGLAFFVQNHTLCLESGGNVGVNTTTPTETLEINGTSRIDNNDMYLRAGTDRNHGLGYRNTINSGFIDGPFLYGFNGGALGTSSPDTITLSWNYAGDVWVSNNLSTATLTIRGGADVAEPFPVTGSQVEPGTVMVIDDANPGQLRRSTQAYDTRVAGIISGAGGVKAGLELQQDGVLDQGQKVALSGRVYVLADASAGAIKPGDLLTTSSTPGRAMKVSDHARAQDAILGKAMSGLSEGNGLVLVLVTLQ